MTNEEKFKEMAEKIAEKCWLHWNGRYESLEKETPYATKKILKALTEAYEKGREEGSLSHTMTYHQGKKEGWNEAIIAAVKVAEDDPIDHRASKRIATKIEALRKG